MLPLKWMGPGNPDPSHYSIEFWYGMEGIASLYRVEATWGDAGYHVVTSSQGIVWYRIV
jgi:hypothetical protein